MVAVPLGANAFETRAHDVGKKTVLLKAVLVQQVLANTLLPGMMAMHTILYANCTKCHNAVQLGTHLHPGCAACTAQALDQGAAPPKYSHQVITNKIARSQRGGRQTYT